MGIKHAAQHLGGLIHALCNVARVVSRHILLLYFIILLPQELKDALSSISPQRSP